MSDIVFRRIHGRIVPIKKDGAPKAPKSPNLPEVGKGAALTAAGAVTGLYAGKFAAKSVLTAAHAENAARSAAATARGLIARAKVTAIRAASSAAKSKQLILPLEHGSEFLLKKADKVAFGAATHEALAGSTLAARLFRNRNAIRGLGIAVSGGLIAAGLKRAYEGYTGKPSSTKGDIIAGAAGTGAALAVHTGYYKALSLGSGFSKYPEAIRMAFKAVKLAR